MAPSRQFDSKSFGSSKNEQSNAFDFLRFTATDVESPQYSTQQDLQLHHCKFLTCETENYHSNRRSR